jgi:hypothetical protein
VEGRAGCLGTPPAGRGLMATLTSLARTPANAERLIEAGK